MTKKIVIVDYNVGNLKSVQSSFARAGMETVISREFETIRAADALILPGVGAFPTAMTHLEKYELAALLKERAAAGVPILGICLGMQVLFESGSEGKETQGLGLLNGQIQKIETTEKLPHMGWNQLHFNQNQALSQFLQKDDEVYFVHSYAADCPLDEVVAYAQYGQAKIPAIVAKNNVMGCQFHPEKSGPIGQLILKAFKTLIEAESETENETKIKDEIKTKFEEEA